MDALDRTINDLSCCEDISPKQCHSPSILDTLNRRKVSLEAQLGNVNAAIGALNEHPEINKVLELIAKAR